MIYGSVCSGIEAATVAWEPLGWKAAWFSEIEKFPCAVLKHHYPDVPNLGDIYNIYVDRPANLLYSISHGQKNKRVSSSDKDVQSWYVCSRCGGFLWCDQTSNVGVVKKKGCKVQTTPEIRKRESFSQKGIESQQASKSSCRKSNFKRIDNQTEHVRGVRQRLCACKQSPTNRSASQRLQQAIDGEVVVSEMSLGLAQSKQGNSTFIDIRDLDLLVAGFPCQDLSVAGKRKGLRDEKGTPTRSGLFFRIMELADTIGQRWTLLENVPGLLSSNQGRDFAVVVAEMAGVEVDVPGDGWKNSGFFAGPKGLIEWAVLDAQYFGVPQRRRRIFIVRDSGNWRDRPPLLLERESLSGYPPPSRQEGERIALAITGGPPFSRTGNERVEAEAMVIARPLRAQAQHSHREDSDNLVVAFNASDRRQGIDTICKDGTTPTLDGAQGQAVAFQSKASSNNSMNPSEVAPTLDKGKGDGVAVAFTRNNMTVRRLVPVECEFLQGFPRNYTRIPWRGKPAAECPDGPRYKALGNSMAVPVMSWIGQRIADEVRR